MDAVEGVAIPGLRIAHQGHRYRAVREDALEALASLAQGGLVALAAAQVADGDGGVALAGRAG
jgi:hypothetical protein